MGGNGTGEDVVRIVKVTPEHVLRTASMRLDRSLRTDVDIGGPTHAFRGQEGKRHPSRAIGSSPRERHRDRIFRVLYEQPRIYFQTYAIPYMPCYHTIDTKP